MNFLLQRLMGVETHDNLTKFLPAGSAFSITKKWDARNTLILVSTEQWQKD